MNYFMMCARTCKAPPLQNDQNIQNKRARRMKIHRTQEPVSAQGISELEVQIRPPQASLQQLQGRPYHTHWAQHASMVASHDPRDGKQWTEGEKEG